MKAKDITGQRFGKLQVVSYAGCATEFGLKQPAAMWNCACDCGNEKRVRGTALRSGHIASCGCEKLTSARVAGNSANDITGQRFGNLVALFKSKSTGVDNGQRSRWVCQCDCGRKSIVRGKELVHGTTKSCGCGQNVNFYDLSGSRFGSLVVVERSHRKLTYSHNSVWKCLCDCGNIRHVPSGSLKSGNTQSCGCSRRSTPNSSSPEQS